MQLPAGHRTMACRDRDSKTYISIALCDCILSDETHDEIGKWWCRKKVVVARAIRINSTRSTQSTDQSQHGRHGEICLCMLHDSLCGAKNMHWVYVKSNSPTHTLLPYDSCRASTTQDTHAVYPVPSNAVEQATSALKTKLAQTINFWSLWSVLQRTWALAIALMIRNTLHTILKRKGLVAIVMFIKTTTTIQVAFKFLLVQIARNAVWLLFARTWKGNWNIPLPRGLRASRVSAPRFLSCSWALVATALSNQRPNSPLAPHQSHARWLRLCWLPLPQTEAGALHDHLLRRVYPCRYWLESSPTDRTHALQLGLENARVGWMIYRYFWRC